MHGDTVRVECPKCEHRWEYSGYKDRIYCPSCEGSVPFNLARAIRLRNNSAICKLSKHPVTDGNIASQASSVVDVHKFKIPSSKHRKKRKTGNEKNVYYLVGDEREAMRIFIKENEEYIRSVIKDQYGSCGGQSALFQHWDDWKAELLVEMWYWMGKDER